MAYVEHRALWSGMNTQDDDAEIGVLGIPFDGAVSWRTGARLAPARMRDISPHIDYSTEEGEIIHMRVKDYGDMESDLDWARYFDSTEQVASQMMQGQHKLSFFIGGDHSVGIPLFKAFAKTHFLPEPARTTSQTAEMGQAASGRTGKVGYIQFDSHADLADEFESHKWSHACTARRNVEQPNLSPNDMAFVGLRAFLTEEIAYHNEHPKMGWHTARSVYTRGIDAVAQDVVAQLRGVDAVYMSLDIDGIDPSCTPGTGTPEHGGPSLRECLEFLRVIFAELPVKAMDIVEVSPPLDIADVTSLAALKVMYEVFGFVQNTAGSR